MKVVQYLKQNGIGKLHEEFGVIAKHYDEGLIVLNYDQIKSPKNDITNECRGLILDHEFNIVSRSFDRFFNFGENETTFNPNKAVAYEKIDGSLIKIYNFKGTWYVSTRGTAFAESQVNGWPITFKDMVFNALDVVTEEEFQNNCKPWLEPTRTYIFEITGVENRVVTRYNGHTLWFLASRDNNTGDYTPSQLEHVAVSIFGAKFPKTYSFSSTEECVNTAKSLPDLQEGYVLYEDGIPVCKVKSPAYVAIHHLRGEGLNPKRISELIALNQQEEYLTYYGEERKYFTPYITALNNSLIEAQQIYEQAMLFESQKDFALAVKDYPFAAFLFTARKLAETSIVNVFNSADLNKKTQYILSLIKE